MREFRTAVEQTGVKAPDGRKLERVTLGLEIKSLTDDGVGTGYLSAYGNEDSYGDVVDQGAFNKTCAERSEGNPLPFLWQHYSDEPIGIYTRLDPTREFGLYTEFRYALGVQRAREAFELARMRACHGQSIGFTTLNDSKDSSGLRHLKELRLWEGSQVTFPANDLAGITGVKGTRGDVWAEIERLHAVIEELRGQKPAPETDPSTEAAELRSLLADVRSALSGAAPPPAGEPDEESTREQDTAVADLRRQMESYLSTR